MVKAKTGLDLTDKEKKALRFIKRYIKTNKLAPTQAEICNELGTKSNESARQYLARLNRKGYLDLKANKPRAIYPTQKAKDFR